VRVNGLRLSPRFILCRHYYTGVEGVIFVVDSADKERIDEASEELQMLLRENELKVLIRSPLSRPTRIMS